MRGFLLAATALGVLVATPAPAHEERARITGVINWVSWAPGGKILFQSYDGVHSISADGSDLRRIAGPRLGRASWSSRRTIVLTSSDEGGISVAPAEGKRVREIYPRGDFPAWSPEGDRIAFSTTQNIWVMRADGSRVRTVAATSRRTSYRSGPRWSPNGRQLVYAACLRPVQDVCEGGRRATGVFVTSAERRGRPRFVAHGTCPDWSSAGLLSYDDGNGVVVTRANGSGRRVAIPSALQCSSWSPQGSRLAAETRGGVVVAGPGRARRLLRLPPPPASCDLVASSPPAWSPDGRTVAVSRPVGTCGSESYRLYVVRVRDGRTRVIVRAS